MKLYKIKNVALTILTAPLGIALTVALLVAVWLDERDRMPGGR